MTPILGRLGPYLIYSYTVFIGLGILAGLGVTAWRARQRPFPNWFDAALAALLLGLIGGRIGFVLVNWGYFAERPSLIWRFGQGGLVYHGALLGGLLGVGLWCVWRKRPFAPLADLFAPGLALAYAFGWLACWLAGCAYGRETALGPFALAAPDEFGVFAVRYATQIMGLVWGTAVFLFVWLTEQRWRPGQLFWLTLALLSLGRAAISLLRGDPVPLLGDIRLDTLLDSAIALFALIMLLSYKADVYAGREIFNAKAQRSKGAK
jgi:phosphatidylglycerol---prolipoprotein diacylglyceryl transferase